MAKDMDGFQPHLFGGLGRSDAATASGYANASTKRIHAALSGVCAWLLTAFCRAVGYSKLTSDILWEWANFDPLWVAVLAKGALTLDEVVRSTPDTPLTGPFFPPELSRIQNALTGAIVGLISHTVAFQDLEAGMNKNDEVDEVSAPNVKFARHWAKLAMATAESDLVGPLLMSVQGPAADKTPQLVQFFAKILQPELLQDPAWIGAFPAAPLIVEAARGAAGNVRGTLGRHGQALWAMFATVPTSGQLPRSFLKDCSDIAFRSPVAVPECMSLVRAVLAGGHQVLEVAGADPAPLTALCMLAANAGVVPGSPDDGGLVHAVGLLQPEVRMLVAGRMGEWTGSVAQSGRACWMAYMQGLASPAFVPEQMEAAVTLRPDHQQALGMAGLRKVLTQAPAELCCALDKQLLTDPVRSPYGHNFEYTVLAWTLSQNGGTCPITGQPLSLDSCQRDEQLQQQAASWIQTQYS